MDDRNLTIPAGPGPDVFERFWLQFKAKLKPARQDLERRRLISFLSDRIDTVNGHLEQGLAPGSEPYRELWNQMDARLASFSAKWGVPRKSIEAQVPSLRQCQRLTQAETQIHPALKLLGWALTGLVSLFLLGVLAGVTHTGYVWTGGLFHVH